MCLRRVNIPCSGVSHVIFEGSSHDLVGHWERMDGVATPLGTDLFGFFIFKGGAKAEHSVGAQNPEIARPAREESVSEVLLQTEDVGAECGQVIGRRIVGMVFGVTAARLKPVACERGQKDFPRLPHRFDYWG